MKDPGVPGTREFEPLGIPRLPGGSPSGASSLAATAELGKDSFGSQC